VISEEWELIWRGQRLAGVFYRIPGVGYKVGVKRPTATQSMGKILCGEMSYGDVAGRALKRLSSSRYRVWVAEEGQGPRQR